MKPRDFPESLLKEEQQISKKMLLEIHQLSGNPLPVLTDKAEELCHCVTYQFDTLTDLGMPEKKLRAFSVIEVTGKHTHTITSICTHKNYFAGVCACHTRRRQNTQKR